MPAETRSSRLQAPDGLPTLGKGRHRHISGGACLMEYVSVLAGVRFNDHPSCTHPALSALGRLVNDHITDEGARQQLTLLAPTLIGTARGDARITATVVACCLQTAAMNCAADPMASIRDRLPLRRLARTRVRLKRLTASRWARRWATWGQLMGIPATSTSQVTSAFRVLRKHATRLPVSQRDALLLGLLADVLDSCQELRSQSVAASKPPTVVRPYWSASPRRDYT
jgi:hypothetical protein